MKKTDLERLRKVVTTWDSLSAQMAQRNITRDVLMADEFAQWAVTTPLYNIGEQVYQLTQGLKAKCPEQPWNAVSGMRHRLVHEYEGINWTMIVEIVFEDMPGFVQDVRKIIAEIEENE